MAADAPVPEAPSPLPSAPLAIGAAHRRGRRRHRWLVAGCLVLTSVAAAFVVVARLREHRPPVERPPVGNIVYVDVVGWYGRSPAEVAARTPYALSLAALPVGLPLAMGAWRGEDRPHDPAVDVWLNTPEVSVERTYRRSDGSVIWLSIFGSRGTKSYHLFEHTPETCYPLGGWQLDRFEVLKLPRGPRPLPVNFGIAHNGSQQLVFAHLYVWDSPSRDPERGVLSVRLASPVRTTPEDAVAAMSVSFLGQLFPSTLSWRRF